MTIAIRYRNGSMGWTDAPQEYIKPTYPLPIPFNGVVYDPGQVIVWYGDTIWVYRDTGCTELIVPQ